MALIVRYACLLALAVGSVYAFLTATTVTGEKLLAEAGHRVDDPGTIGVWIIAAMTAFGLLSVFRFVFARLPAMARDWYANNKERLMTLLLIGLVGGIFLIA